MASLADLYNQIADYDAEIEKVAAEEAVSELFETEDNGFEDNTMKVAAEYDAAGRIMARAYFSEMLKSASDDEDEDDEDGMKEKEDKDEDDKKKKKKKGLPPGMEEMMEEKKAAYKQRMLEDPEFAQAMFERYSR